jgi:hypothetical protein
VTRSLEEPYKKWNGTPVMRYMDSQRSNNVFRKLPAFEKRISDLEQVIIGLDIPSKK